MTTIYAGLDIAKSNLQLHLAGRFYDLPNTAPGTLLTNRVLPHSGLNLGC